MGKKNVSKQIDSQESLKTSQESIKKENAQISNKQIDEVITEETMTFMEELPHIDVKDTFYRSMMQNQFLHHLRNKNVYIAIQTVTNEIYIGTLISFDEYTIHVYVEDKKFNSAMLFFKSGLTYIRVLTEAAYQYYIDKFNNEEKQFPKNNNNFKSNTRNNAKINTNNKTYIPAKAKPRTDNNTNNNNKKFNSTDDMAKTLSAKFNVTTQNKNKRKDF